MKIGDKVKMLADVPQIGIREGMEGTIRCINDSGKYRIEIQMDNGYKWLFLPTEFKVINAN